MVRNVQIEYEKPCSHTLWGKWLAPLGGAVGSCNTHAILANEVQTIIVAWDT